MSSHGAKGVLGIASEAAVVEGAIRVLQQEGFADITAYLPVPEAKLLAMLHGRPSPVRVWTLAGGILGCLSGFALTIYTVLDLPIRTGSKPIISIPPFLIIVFELTILLGALGAVLGFLVSARLPRPVAPANYQPEFSRDRFGLYVPEEEETERVAEILRRAGMEEVRVES